MLIPSTPGAPLLALTRFHASAILAGDAMYSTGAKSIGDGSVTRQAPKSSAGLGSYLSSRACPITAFRPLFGIALGLLPDIGSPLCSCRRLVLFEVVTMTSSRNMYRGLALHKIMPTPGTHNASRRTSLTGRRLTQTSGIRIAPLNLVISQKRSIMQSNPVVWFEIYVQDMQRAKKFMNPYLISN